MIDLTSPSLLDTRAYSMSMKETEKFSYNGEQVLVF